MQQGGDYHNWGGYLGGVESIDGAIQLCLSLVVIYVLFLNCCELRIRVINSRW